MAGIRELASMKCPGEISLKSLRRRNSRIPHRAGLTGQGRANPDEVAAIGTHPSEIAKVSSRS